MAKIVKIQKAKKVTQPKTTSIFAAIYTNIYGDLGLCYGYDKKDALDNATYEAYKEVLQVIEVKVPNTMINKTDDYSKIKTTTITISK